MLLSMDLQKLRLYLTEANGRIKPHQKWVKNDPLQLKWFDPTTNIYHDISVAKEKHLFTYKVVKGSKFSKLGRHIIYREEFKSSGESIMFVFYKDGTLDIKRKLPPMKLNFGVVISK